MKKTLYITATLPALTVTFIYREIARLRALGMQVDTVSMNTPSAGEISEAARELRRTTLYLDSLFFVRKLLGFLLTLVIHPLRTFRCLKHLLFASPVKFPRDTLRLAYHLVEAGYLARKFAHSKTEHIHCHFINGPTSIGMYLSILLDIPYSFTMHASMIWLDPIAFANKLKTCAFCVSISEYNKRYVVDTYGAELADKIHIVHCGLDPESDRVSTVTKDQTQSFEILGVGQLNRRKGFHILIPALTILRDRGVDFKCTIIGNGDEMTVLQDLVERDQLHDNVELAGAVLHEDVKKKLGQADAFVLPCVISEDGWRDGIPVALMEAMLNEVPVVSTDILGLPELIDHEISGLLVPAEDVEALADSLARLSAEPQLRARLGEKGRQKVLQDFNNELSASKLLSLIESCQAGVVTNANN
jgi:colanic acid/amylovoran biosynthesis glycosyltransferase